MDLSPADIKLILSTLQESEFDQAEVVVGDVRISVARGGASLNAPSVDAPAAAPTPATPAPAPAAASMPAPAAAPAELPAASAGSGHIIASPSVGVFWRASTPGAAPFVEVGQEVAVGDTVGIVEMMKLMSNISADVAGVVTAIHVENAGSIEFGTPLVTIEPKA